MPPQSASLEIAPQFPPGVAQDTPQWLNFRAPDPPPRKVSRAMLAIQGSFKSGDSELTPFATKPGGFPGRVKHPPTFQFPGPPFCYPAPGIPCRSTCQALGSCSAWQAYLANTGGIATGIRQNKYFHWARRSVDTHPAHDLAVWPRSRTGYPVPQSRPLLAP